MVQEREVIITDRGSGGLGTGVILGIVGVLLVIAILVWGIGFNGFGGGGGNNAGGGGGNNNPVATQAAAPTNPPGPAK